MPFLPKEFIVPEIVQVLDSGTLAISSGPVRDPSGKIFAQFSLYQDALVFDEAGVASVPRTFIDCIEPALPHIAAMRRRVRAEPCWCVVELATGDDAMVSAPEELSAALLERAQPRARQNAGGMSASDEPTPHALSKC